MYHELGVSKSVTRYLRLDTLVMSQYPELGMPFLWKHYKNENGNFRVTYEINDNIIFYLIVFVFYFFVLAVYLFIQFFHLKPNKKMSQKKDFYKKIRGYMMS